MITPRHIAGFFAGAGALLLIYKGNIIEGMTILVMLVSFFVGEQNGKRTNKS